MQTYSRLYTHWMNIICSVHSRCPLDKKVNSIKKGNGS